METIIPQNLIEGANNNSFFNRGSGLEREAQNESGKGCPGIPEGSAEKIDAELARCPYRRHKFFFTDQDQAYIHARKVGSREDVVESLVRKMGSTITRYTFFKDMEKQNESGTHG